MLILLSNFLTHFLVTKQQTSFVLFLWCSNNATIIHRCVTHLYGWFFMQYDAISVLSFYAILLWGLSNRKAQVRDHAAKEKRPAPILYSYTSWRIYFYPHSHTLLFGFVHFFSLTILQTLIYKAFMNWHNGWRQFLVSCKCALTFQ